MNPPKERSAEQQQHRRSRTPRPLTSLWFQPSPSGGGKLIDLLKMIADWIRLFSEKARNLIRLFGGDLTGGILMDFEGSCYSRNFTSGFRSGFWGWNVLNRWRASFSGFLPCGKASSNPITQKQTDHPHFSTEMAGVKPFPNWSFLAGKYCASL